MVVFHIDIINAIAQARNIRHLLASDILERWQQGEEATPDQAQSLIQLGNWIDFLTDSEQLVVDGCIDSTDIWNIIQQIGEQAIGLDCVGTNYSYNNPPPVPNVNILNYVESVNGLNTNNTDPQNPIVRISVDGLTITGNGTPASPLVATAPLGGVQSVTGNLVNNANPENPVVNSPLTADELAAIQGANAPDGTNVFATLADITGGSQDLAQTLTNGNTSGANDIEFDATQGLLFSNTSRLREGTIDAGLGGQKGIAEICGVGFESKWEAGRRYIMGSSGNTIRQSLYNFNIPPTTSDDASIGYQDGSLWTLDDSTTYVCTDSVNGIWVEIGLTAGVVEITSTDLLALIAAGTLSLTTIYIVTDAPYRIALQAEAVNKIGANGTIVDLTYSGSVYYDVITNTIVNGTISDIDGNTWNGCLPSATIFAISGLIPSKNTFYQGAITNQLGESCDGNIFNAKASENTLGDICYYNTFGQRAITNTLGESCNHNFFHQNSCLNELGINCRNNIFGQGSVSNILGDGCEFNTFGQDASSNTVLDDSYNNTFEQGANNNFLRKYCYNNTFKQGANGFIFFDALQNTTIEAGVTGADYTATPDYAFLYNNAYASTIFTDGTDNYHRYYDPANDRIVLHNLSTPLAAPTYIGGGAGSGTVTSVDLTMPSAFSVSGNPITTSGTISVTGAGLTSQYVRGDGSLANFPTSGGGGASVNYYLNGSVSQGTFGGDAYYEMSKTPILGAGTNFIRTNGSGNGYIASFITDAGDPSFLNIPSGNWNLEFYFQSSASGGSPQFYGEIYKVSATNVFTLVASGSANPEDITNGTTVDQYFTSIPVPQTSLLITDRLAVRIYVITGGRTITLHTENGNLCEVLTTFTTGLTALNGLTEQIQTFATGTTGTDFAISSASGIHNFNLPTASASNRGALSSADWSAFNGKQDTLVSGTSIKTVEGSTLLGSAPIVVAREIQLACSDETTALTTGAAKVTFRAPRAMVITGVRASLTTAQTSGSIFTVDINESGTSILSTKLTIDNTEKTSTTAATPPVIIDSAIADDAEITIDIDQVGDGTAKGLKVTILYTI